MEIEYGHYCTPLSQSDCRYFFVLAIMPLKPTYEVDQKDIHPWAHSEPSQTSKMELFAKKVKVNS